MNSRSSGSGGFKNSNLNSVLSKQDRSSSSQNSSKPYANGLVALGAPKRSRTAAGPAAAKLAVPKPVNLPSLRSENAGNDPSTQIVPSGGGGSWQKPEEQQAPAPQPQTSALTAGSNWATPSALRGDGSSAPWQPPDISFPVTPSLPAGDRRLNPREYPSLSVAAASKPSGLRQPVPSVPETSGQRTGKWDEDERQLPSSALIGNPSAEWSKEKNFEEDERLGPPLWDSRDRGWRDGKGSFTDRDANRFGVEEDRWVPGGGSRGYPPNRFEGRPSLDSRAYADADYVGIGTSALDDSLLYPPFVRPAPPPSNDDQADKVAEAQENKKQFELFLDEYAEKLSKDKRQKEEREAKAAEEAAAAKAAEAAAAKAEAEAAEAVREPPQTAAQAVTGVPPPSKETSTEGKQESAVDARARVAAARKRKEEEERQLEEKRKEAAAARLRDLEERIARKMEEEKKKAEEEAARKAAAEEADSRAAAEAAEQAALAAAEKKSATNLAPPVDDAGNVQDYSSSSTGQDVEEAGRLLLNGADDVDGEESREGSIFVHVTDSVAQVEDALTSEDEVLEDVTSAERYSVLPSAVPEDAILSQHQVASWDTPVRPALPNGGPVSPPILGLVMDTATMGHGMNDIGGAHEPFNAEAILSEVLGEDDPPRPQRPLPPTTAEVLAQHQPVKPVDVQPSAAQAAAAKPRAWRNVLLGQTEEELPGQPVVESRNDSQKPQQEQRQRGPRGGRGRDRDRSQQKVAVPRDGEHQGDRSARQDVTNQRARDGKDRGQRGGPRASRGNSDGATGDTDLGQPEAGGRRGPRGQRGKFDGRSEHASSTQGSVAEPGAASRGQRPNRRQAGPTGQDGALRPSVASSGTSGGLEPPASTQATAPKLSEPAPAAVVVPVAPAPQAEPAAPPSPAPLTVLAPPSNPTGKEPPGLHAQPGLASLVMPHVAVPSLNNMAGEPTWGSLSSVPRVSVGGHNPGFDPVWSNNRYVQGVPQDAQAGLSPGVDILAPRTVISDTGDNGLQAMDRMQARPASAGTSAGFDLNRPKLTSELGLSPFAPTLSHGSSHLQQNQLAGLTLPPTNHGSVPTLAPPHVNTAFRGAFQYTAQSMMPPGIQQVWEAPRATPQPMQQGGPAAQQPLTAAVTQNPRAQFLTFGSWSGSAGGVTAPQLGMSTHQPPPPPPPATQPQATSFFGNFTGAPSGGSLQFPGWATGSQQQAPPQEPFVPTGRAPDWRNNKSGSLTSQGGPPPGLHIDPLGGIRSAAPPSMSAANSLGPSMGPPGLSARGPSHVMHGVGGVDGSAAHLQHTLAAHQAQQTLGHNSTNQLQLPYGFDNSIFNSTPLTSSNDHINPNKALAENLLPDDIFPSDDGKVQDGARQPQPSAVPNRAPAPTGPAQGRRGAGQLEGGQRRPRNPKPMGGRGDNGRGFSGSRGRGRAGPEAQPVGDANGGSRPRAFDNGPQDGPSSSRNAHMDPRSGRGRGRGDRGGRGGGSHKIYVPKGNTAAPGLANGPAAIANGILE